MDRAFDWTASQTDIYTALGKKVVDGITIGLNGTIFAYGQTGSGKTYTMANEQGIIPRCIDDLFSFLKAKTDQLTRDEFQSEMHISYVQLYQEEWYDLLDGNVKLQFRTSTGLNSKRFKVTSPAEALKLLSEGWNARKTAETRMNRASSRSHCVFVIELTTEELVDDLAERRTSKLHLVDLAGSERIAQTGVESLTCLARVMRQLSEKKSVISYRDSKLTLFLKDSLGGKARTSIVVTVHSEKSYLTNIISSLQFARDCRTIENHLQVNMKITGNTVMALSNKVNNLNQQFQDAQLEYKAMLQSLQEENEAFKRLTLKQSAEIDALKTKLCFEDERLALQTPKTSAKRRRTLYASSEEVRRSVERTRTRTLKFDDEEEVAPHVYIAEKNMASFSQEENKENDLEIELNYHRQLIEEKNQEILALKDQANAVQAEAQIRAESLTKQLEEGRRTIGWLERNNLEMTKQNANLIKEKQSIESQLMDVQSAHRKTMELLDDQTQATLQLRGKNEQLENQIEEFRVAHKKTAATLDKEKHLNEDQVKALREEHRKQTQKLESAHQQKLESSIKEKQAIESQLMEVQSAHRKTMELLHDETQATSQLREKNEQLENQIEEFRIAQEKTAAALVKEKQLNQDQLKALREEHHKQTQKLESAHQQELESSVKEKQAIESQLMEVQSAHTKTAALLKDQIQLTPQLREKNEQLEDQIEELRVAHERTVAALDKEKQLNRDQVKALREEHRKQTQKLESAHQQELESLQERQALATRLHEQSVQEWQKKLDTINTNYADQDLEKKSLASQLSSQRHDLQEALDRNRSLEVERRDLETKIMALERNEENVKLANEKIGVLTKELEETKKKLTSEVGHRNTAQKIHEMQRLLTEKSELKNQLLAYQQTLAKANKELLKAGLRQAKLPSPQSDAPTTSRVTRAQSSANQSKK
ncbi:unnamed protein product, partial [Mesorhabditis belari]|uniref:Kinesin-like protein n=1 Tax=Mesorhabditis belari TaxID=2138241 RepID=A0AAF3J7T8_9BILA